METLVKRRGRPNTAIPEDDAPNQVRALRLSKEWTLEYLAGQIKVDPNSLSEFERKGTGLGRKKQHVLAKVLDVQYGVLVQPGKNFIEKVSQLT